jgi:hypothetical protein
MKGDFSKWYADPNDNYNGVLHQQGRVLLDSDWNAQTQILNDWQTIAGQDIIGAGVAAVPAENPDAFKVIQAQATTVDNKDRVELTLLPGRIWADGLLVYLDGDKYTNGKPILLGGKAIAKRIATYLLPPIQEPPKPIDNTVRDAVILEVWQEAFNGFQKPETLIEPALGGPDTTERLQTAMAWRLYRLADDENCDNIRDKLHDNKGTLTVSLQDPITITNEDCPVVSAGGYTGFEHYLYRVEIAHTKDTPKFKWSQFNGGLVGRGVFQAPPPGPPGQPGKVIITHNLQAIIHADIKNFYLEVIEYDAASGNQQVIYGATTSLNNSNELELATTDTFRTQPVSPPPAPGELPKTYFFRLWNGIEDIAAFAVNPAKELQYGILLKFEDPTSAGKTYTPGDYWTFKVRAGEIPNVSPLINKQPPEGIVYHRVPLAELHWQGTPPSMTQEIEDCRQPFRPLTNQKGCCTFSVGDGKRSQGDFNSIEDAIHHLPPNGGKICVLPGIHTANVEIFNRRDIQITGCGVHSIVHPQATEALTSEPIFRIAFSRNIQIDRLTLVTLAGTAIQVLDGKSIPISATRQVALNDSTSIHILWNQIIASIHGIEIRTRNETQAGNNDIWIAHNQIYLLDKPSGKAAILSIADGVLIERNRLLVVPPPQEKDPKDSRQPDDPSGGAFDPCKPLKFYYGSQFPIYKFVQSILLYAAKFLVVQKPIYLAQGGIQIGSSSDGVKIIRNEIIGGRGHGITLGHLPPELVDIPFINQVLISRLTEQQIKSLKPHPEFLNAIAIEGNHIQRMGLSGISVAAFTHLEIGWMVRVDDLTIYRNVITHCAQQLPSEIPSNLIAQVAFGGIALADAEDVTIQENRIEANGIDHTHPVCGIFISLGEKIDISNNRILSNGSRISEQSGVRGGVVIAMSFKSLVNILAGDEQFLSPDGIPAVKIHDNIITQPLGHALFLIAFGPVSVVGNHLTSQSVDKKNPFSLLAGAVFILNLGVSKDLMTLFFLASFSQLGTANAAPTNNMTALQADRTIGLRKILYLPDGMVLFTNNQVTLDLRLDDVTIIFSSQFIISLDDVAYNSNQAECNSFSNPKLNQQNIPTDIVLTDVAIVGVTVRSNDNRFQEGFTFSPASLFSLGIMNTGTGNQATHCLHILGVPLWTVNNDNLVLFDGERCSETTQLLRRIF